MARPKIVPELYCSDINRSLSFYTEVCGFLVRYARPGERFAYLDRNGAELMIEQPADPKRTILAATLEHPFGRGVNLQIEVNDVERLHERARAAGCRIILPLEDRWYRIDHNEAGNRQFAVMDPDGYILRFFCDLGRRPA
jgi:catechol 2,3-dioxygenase-like lactoylglutathione lyase family enzyme